MQLNRDNRSGRVTRYAIRDTQYAIRNTQYAIRHPPSAIRLSLQDVLGNVAAGLQRLHAEVGVALRHPPGLVKEILLRAVSEVDAVCREPEPDILITHFGDYAVHYDIRYWITDYARALQIHDRVMMHIWYELRRAGMTIPFPRREVLLHPLSGDQEARDQEHAQRQIVSTLRQLTVFAPLDDDQIERLAHGAALHRYTAGERLVRQGEIGSSLFVITGGQVRVDVQGNNGKAVTVARLGPGEFFGEMSLLTGEPRSASVLATTETQVVEVDKAAFAAIVAADTEIVEALSIALETRGRQLAEQLASATETHAERPAPQQTARLHRIRSFFGIEPH